MGVAILISDKVDFKIKTITRNKERYHIMMKGSIQEKDVMIINIYSPKKKKRSTSIYKANAAAAAAKSLQSCPTLCDPIDGGPPGSPSLGFSRQEHFLLQCMKGKSESEVAQSYPTLRDPMDCSPAGSPSTGFSRQECSNKSYKEALPPPLTGKVKGSEGR